MWDKPTQYCEGWNFGPRMESITSVWEVSKKIMENYKSGKLKDLSDPNALHEAKLLMLDITKVRVKLGWEPRMNITQCIQLVADWYKRYQTENVYDLCIEQINQYLKYPLK